jgi:hypothetical protein
MELILIQNCPSDISVTHGMDFRTLFPEVLRSYIGYLIYNLSHRAVVTQ